MTVIVGTTTSQNSPLTYPVDGQRGTREVFAVKLSADGPDLLFSTLVAGRLNDIAYGVALDPAGGVFIAGSPESANFPATAGAF